MDEKEFEAEKLYYISMSIAKSMLEKGIICNFQTAHSLNKIQKLFLFTDWQSVKYLAGSLLRFIFSVCPAAPF